MSLPPMLRARIKVAINIDRVAAPGKSKDAL